jgi:hypothetical protein
LTRRRLVAAIALTGGVFAALKLWPDLASRVASAWGHVAPGAKIQPDPTDLLALPALAIAYWIGAAELRWIEISRSRTSREATASAPNAPPRR